MRCPWRNKTCSYFGAPQHEIDEAVNALAQEHGLEVDVHTELDALADSADGRFVYHAEEGPYSPVLFLAQ